MNILGSGTVAVKNLDGEELGLLCNTVGSTANGTSDVAAVTVAISVAAVDKVGSPRGSATEVLFRAVSISRTVATTGEEVHLRSG